MAELTHLALALDIGTRKVVGLITTGTGRGLRIVAAARMEHPTRAMFDGQVHDVAQVAAAVAQVKARLEARAGVSLREAAVAAAGRALRTYKGTAGRDLTGLKELTAADVYALELEAVQAAQQYLAEALRESGEAADYHYVGHSVAGCRLDGTAMGALTGQRGCRAELDVIATFLPRLVIDSLLAVLERCGLEMTALTLEPIAAISVVIPPNMRHLNLALVDVGAGTSDIAITQGGNVVAYDMVPCAGDEITEALAGEYLLDFPTGEAVKRALDGEAAISFTDILGHRHQLPPGTVRAALAPAVQQLAGLIAERIRRLAGIPQAVVLVGGGALTSGLPAALARQLGLPESRVAVRGRGAIAGVSGFARLLSGPDAVTPIGIAVASRQSQHLGFEFVTVQGRGVRLLGPGRHTVADALLAAGIPLRDLQGRSGPGLTITVNGKLQLIPGRFGRPAAIRVDGAAATLQTPVTHRAAIDWTPAVPGEAGAATVAAVAGELAPLSLSVDGEPVQVAPLYSVGGRSARPEQALADNDVVTARLPANLGEVLTAMGRSPTVLWVDVPFSLEGQPQRLRRPRGRLWLDDAPAGLETPVSAGSRIRLEPLPPPSVAEAVGAPLSEAKQARPLRLLVNGAPVEFKAGPGVTILRAGHPVAPAEPLRPGDSLQVQAEPPIFAELLERLRFSPSPPAGKEHLHMAVNGEPAQFITPLADGDRVDLVWE